MREIKFRAWDFFRKEWRLIKGLVTNTEGKVTGFISGGIEYHLNDKDIKVKLVEFTGLKDKNGKEIYEGDIVKICELNYKVIFDESLCCFRLVNYNLKFFKFREIHSHDLIVNGNIYENPELLKETK